MFIDGDRGHSHVYARRNVRGERESSFPTLVFHPALDGGASAARGRCSGAAAVSTCPFVYVCVWCERRGKRSSASLNRAQHTRTHPPGCYRSSGSRVLRVIYTHPHAGARIDGVTFGFGFLLFFHRRLSLFNRNAARRLRLRCRGEKGRYRN